MVKQKSVPKKSTAKRWRQAFEVIRFCGAEPEEAARLIMRHTELKKMQEADAATASEPIEVEIEEPAVEEEEEEEEPLEDPEPEEPPESEPEEPEELEEKSEEPEPEPEPEEGEKGPEQFSMLRSLMSGSFLPGK